jgi:DNA-binding NarL/FixJ family response regulator
MIVMVAVTDLFFKGKIVEVAHQVAGDIVITASAEAVHDVAAQLSPSRLIIDLNEKAFDAIATIKDLKKTHPSIHVVGFVSHVDRELQAKAKLAGCDEILARSVFVTKLPALLV